MLVEQLGNHLKELKTLESASSVDEARTTLNSFLPLKNMSEKRWRNK